MDPYERVNPRTAEKQPLYKLGPYGPIALHLLAVDERHQEAQDWMAIWSATHSARRRPPGAWRRRFGALLVRAGTRLQRIPPLAGAEAVRSVGVREPVAELGVNTR